MKGAARLTREAEMDDKLKDLRQTVYRRVQLATALHVIKSTPAGKAPETYAECIQAQLKDQWYNTDNSKEPVVQNTDSLNFKPELDKHILNQQKQALASRLLSVLPTDDFLSSELDEDISDAFQWDEDINEVSHGYGELTSEKNSFLSNIEDIRINSEFIKGIIQLKALIDTTVTVPASAYVGIISKISSATTPSLCERKSKPSTLKFSTPVSSLNLPPSNTTVKCDQHDSGILSSETLEECVGPKSLPKVTSVASSVLQYVVSSSDAVKLLQKSTEAVLLQIKKFLEVHNACAAVILADITSDWIGSVNHHAVALLHKIVNSSPSTSYHERKSNKEACFSFIHQALEIITTTSDLLQVNPYIVKEHQCMIAIQFCRCLELSTYAIDITLEKIQGQVKIFQRGQQHDSSDEEDFSYSAMWICDESEQELELQGNEEASEHIMYLFYIADGLLRFYRDKLRSICMAEKKRECTQGNPSESSLNQSKSKQNSIAELWRKQCMPNREPDKHHDSTKEDSEIVAKAKNFVSRWKHALESILLNSSDCALITFYAAECLQLLPCFSIDEVFF